MTHWNYRLLARTVSNEIEFGIYEVYYENDEPVSCSTNPIYPSTYGSDENFLDSIKWELNAMKLAVEKPILDYDDFPKKYDIRRKKLQYLN